ncbi:BHLH domain-containing protein [Aphis craccivora]|uniref:BHLH domain-containing protein n=1 Tax=Aphis craccivora TaxID=307492 RepID=A0A6G0YTV7_APHCR|nr:BHLH domain-containing protein [Aphis craccivora]
MHALDSTNYIIILSLTAFYFILKAPYYSCDSDITQFDNNYPATRNESLTSKSRRPKRQFKNLQHRKMHNAKEREFRRRISQRFDTLRESCSFLNTNKRIPSKISILLAAKKECILLKKLENKLMAEKKLLCKANGILNNRFAELTKMTK